MSIRKAHVAALVAATGAAILAGATPAHASDSRSGGEVICAADEVVHISTVITQGSTSHRWSLQVPGVVYAHNFTVGTDHDSRTGSSFVGAWAVYTSGTFLDVSVYCGF